MKKLLRIFIVLGFVIGGQIALYAQPSVGPPPGGGGSTGSTAPCWQPNACVPIDGGVGFLLVAGAALGARKLYNEKNKSRA